MNHATGPSKIVIIRHAEKPSDGTDPHLAAAGWQRAWALAAHPGTVGSPSVLFAAAASQASNRPIETIAPLAAALTLPINASVADRDVDALATSVLAPGASWVGKTVLVCWHHEHIPKLAHKLGAADAPQSYSDVYDQVWELTPMAGGGWHCQVRAMDLSG